MFEIVAVKSNLGREGPRWLFIFPGFLLKALEVY